MVIELQIYEDNQNSYPNETLKITNIIDRDFIWIAIGDREVAVDKDEFIRATRVLK